MFDDIHGGGIFIWNKNGSVFLMLEGMREQCNSREAALLFRIITCSKVLRANCLKNGLGAILMKKKTTIDMNKPSQEQCD